MFKISFIFSIIIFSSFSQARQSCDWPFLTEINVTETSGQTTSNYPVKLTLTGNSGGTLHTSYNWSSDGSDLRLYSEIDSTPLDFSIESWSQSNKTAEVWVTIPSFTANMSHTIYVYYGNNAVTTADSGTPPGIIYVDDQIKFHTRYNNRNTNDPTSLSHAKALFDAQDDSVAGYGCSHPVQYQGITNGSQGGVNNDFIAVSEAYFTVPSSGQWGVRYGADYGLGGGLYVNGIALDERWNDDLWWGGSDWNNADVLQGLVNLSAGEHKLEVIGGEGCCDGGLTIQFYNGSTDTWGLASDPNVNIDIRSQACPVVRHTIQYGDHDTCDVDLALDPSQPLDNEWFVGSSNEISLQVSYVSSTPDSAAANPITQVEIQLPTEVTLDSHSGSNWSCSGVSATITCIYSPSLNAGSNLSSTLLLTSSVSGTATAGSIITISASVTGNSQDTNLTNNNLNQDIELLSNVGLPAGCSTPKLGMWASYYEITGEAVINNANAYDALITSYKTDNHLLGKTVIANINHVGNPFDPAPSTSLNDFLLVLEGYLLLPSAGQYRFGVDGSDAVQARIGSTPTISAYYDNHGLRGSARNKKRITLTSGFHPLEYRAQKNTGTGAYDFYWRTPSTSSYSIAPSGTYYHCAGNADIQLSSDINVISDGINPTLPKAIPGAELNIKVTATNSSNISTDVDSTVIIQSIDAGTELFIGDFNGTGPIRFIDTTTLSTLGALRGLRYDPNGVNDASHGLSFSTNGVTYQPPSNFSSTAYEPSITHLRLQLDGSMLPSMGSGDPSFSFEYQVRVK